MTQRGKKPRRRLSVRIAGSVILVLALILAVELVSAVTWFAWHGRWLSHGRLQARRLEIRQQTATNPIHVDDRPEWVLRDEEALHPYVGFVLDPNHERSAGIHEWGFHDLDEILEPPRRDRVIVAILGGSVAGQLWNAREPIERGLRELPAYRDKEIFITRIAFGGFKQPQQTLSLEYLLSLGAHFDVVINLDGFNEVVLPWHDNGRHGVFPFYPRGWYDRTGSLADIRLVSEVGAVAILTETRGQLAERLADSSLRWSFTANLLWELADSRLQHLLTGHEEAARILAEETPYFRTGPSGPFDREEVLAESARVWARSSISIQALAIQHEFRYVHFLQPNQYLADSKPFSAEERRGAVRFDQGYGPDARDGYPLLVESGATITAAGVAYYDLTDMFAGESRTIYRDACCHLTPLGLRLMAERVASVLRDELP